jgi:flagellar protein FlgJ
MTPKQFVATLLPHAKETEKKTGIPAEVILAQAALESGWGRSAPGNMYFGVKDLDGLNGNEQLVTTFEYSSKPNLDAKQIGLHSVSSVTPVILNGKPFYKYIGKAYFRKYDSPEGSFTGHASLFLKPHYAAALKVKDDPEKFFRAIQQAGYAQSPLYADSLMAVLKTVQRNMPK